MEKPFPHQNQNSMQSHSQESIYTQPIIIPRQKKTTRLLLFLVSLGVLVKSIETIFNSPNEQFRSIGAACLPFGILLFLIVISPGFWKPLQIGGKKISSAKSSPFSAPVVCCILLIIVNFILTRNGVSATTVLYLTLGIIGSVFLLSLRHHFVAHSIDADVEIQTPPGSAKPFEVSVLLVDKHPKSQKNTTGYPPTEFISVKLKISIIIDIPQFWEKSKNDREEKMHLWIDALSASFTITSISAQQYSCVLDNVSLDENVTHPADYLSKEWPEDVLDMFKQMPAYQEYLKVAQLAEWMSQALKGGPEAQAAKQQVKKILESSQLPRFDDNTTLKVGIGKNEMIVHLTGRMW